MFVVIVQFDSKSEHRKALIDALIDYGGDVQHNEPGTIRFEIIQDRRNLCSGSNIYPPNDDVSWHQRTGL